MTGAANRHAPELVIAFVAATGSDRDAVLEATTRILHGFDYETATVRLSSVMERSMPAGSVPAGTRDRAWALQTEGNRRCEAIERGDALAFLAVEEVRAHRVRLNAAAGREASELVVAPKTAYLIWTLKRPAEARTLRAIYRTRFVLISVQTPLRDRIERIAQDEADREGHLRVEGDDTGRARELIERDESEATTSDSGFTQNVSGTYPLADFFVDASSPDRLEETLLRALTIVFGDPFATPTRSEFGMFLAHAAALKSAELGRQVGAALMTADGDVIALGTNEIPKPGGGHYWHDDPGDDREFVRGFDTSDRLRKRLIAEIADAASPLLGDGSDVRERLTTALGPTRLQDLIEYGRAVHAEMAALLDAARNGASVRDSILYVTTFPCHLCTRMILAAGVTRVEYIYPYPKSLATDLYRRTVRTVETGELDSVPFLPFIGVAPRRYPKAFTAPIHRKERTGEAVARFARSPRLLLEDETGEWDLSTHLARELNAIELSAKLRAKSVTK